MTHRQYTLTAQLVLLVSQWLLCHTLMRVLHRRADRQLVDQHILPKTPAENEHNIVAVDTHVQHYMLSYTLPVTAHMIVGPGQ